MSEESKTLPATPEARPLEVLLTLPADALLNPEEVRIYARLKSRQAVYNWLNDKNDRLPGMKKGGWRIVKCDLDAYLRQKHNRRDSDRADEPNTSDETLRRQLAQLIEIGQSLILWRRANSTWLAAGDPYGPGGGKPDVEWINKAFDDANAKREHLVQIGGALSEEMLTRLRFMLPSMHSDLALPDHTEEDSGASAPHAAPLARSR